jgi:hypothetical protein|tara:strand:- start:2660 stop:3592 length:933 start_codon:yes stop_codon:yes gene_type:complete
MEKPDEQIMTEPSKISTDVLSFKEPDWKGEHEVILVEWADKAMCYRWLHARSHQAYSKTNAWFTIPVIIMSTLTGTANFAQDRFSEEIKPYMQMAIGAVNIFAGILTTIAQFLKVGELNEAHRVSSISWDKFYRNIKVELAKSRDERMTVNHMLKICKEEYDRLMETSPTINENIIAHFNYTFPVPKSLIADDTDKEMDRPDIKRPEICDELVSTAEILFHTPEVDKNALAQPAMMEVIRRKNQIMANYEKEVTEWVDRFEEKHNRKPLESEMLDNLQDKMNPDILEKIVNKVLEGFEHHDDENDALNNI